MHARIDHLLSLRDGEPVDLAVRSHVEACSECAQTRASLDTVRRRLAALPVVDAPADGWARVRARIESHVGCTGEPAMSMTPVSIAESRCNR